QLEIAQPRQYTSDIKCHERDLDNGECKNPNERTPVRICDLEQAHREQKQECRQPDRQGDPFSTFYFLLSTFPSRPAFPAQPEKEKREERNEPTVAVLLVDRPFAAELPAENEPKADQ